MSAASGPPEGPDATPGASGRDAAGAGATPAASGRDAAGAGATPAASGHDAAGAGATPPASGHDAAGAGATPAASGRDAAGAGATPAASGSPGAAPVAPSARRGPVDRLRSLPRAARAGLAVALLAVAALVAALLSGGAGPLPEVLPAAPATLADPVPYDGRSPLQLPGTEQRVLVQLPRRSLGELPDARAMGAEEKRDYSDSLKREATKLRSALAARGVILRDVVSLTRVWNGFAATVRTRDLPRLNSAGARVRTVRRAYPASGEPVPVPGKAPIERAGLTAQPPVAVLDTGVDAGALAEHADPGYDAVERDSDPAPGKDPGNTGRQETSGTALAGIVAAAGERVLPIRVASLRAVAGTVEASTTTDELLAGLEHAVDPNGDADTSDHVPVALIGVNAPYAGFSNSPEAQAVAGAAGLGTLVVAPVGNEGAAAAGSGTIGSPASAPDALAVGALSGPEPAPRTMLDAGGDRIADGAVLAGKPPDDGVTAGPVADTDPAVLGRAQTRIRGKIVIVRAGANPAAQAAAAAAVGARAVLLADPRERPLPAMAAGRAAVPVIGVTGEGAEALLKVKPGTEVSFGATERGPRSDAPARLRVSPNSSQGPSSGGLPKPDLAAPASALAAGAGGNAVVTGGSAVAAARVAAAAARLARARPDLSPAQLRAAMIAAADPAGLPADRAGAGNLRTPAAGGITSDPPTAVSGALDPISVELTAQATTELRLRATGGATVTPATLTLRPGTPAAVTVRLPQGGTALGRLEALDPAGKVVASVPWLVRPDTVDDVPLGELRVSDGGRRVRFTLGAFKRGEKTSIQVGERLILDLVDAQGRPRRSLTVPGGARELMPAEYAYTLPRGSLPEGSYGFRARAWAPRQKQPSTRRSRTLKP